MVRNRQYDLTPREEELMDMMWQANRPMSRAELRNMPVERSWKDNYLPVMLQALEKRGLIQVAGFVREGKTYARQFVPTWSKAELFAKSAAEHLEKDQLPQMLEATSWQLWCGRARAKPTRNCWIAWKTSCRRSRRRNQRCTSHYSLL